MAGPPGGRDASARAKETPPSPIPDYPSTNHIPSLFYLFINTTVSLRLPSFFRESQAGVPPARVWSEHAGSLFLFVVYSGFSRARQVCSTPELPRKPLPSFCFILRQGFPRLALNSPCWPSIILQFFLLSLGGFQTHTTEPDLHTQILTSTLPS